MSTETAHAHQHEADAPVEHPIKIVRPQETDEAVAKDLERAVAPRLTYRHGPLLTNVEVFTVFWGADWQNATEGAVVPQINQFFTDIVTSSLMDEMAEYSVKGHKIGHGKFAGTATVAEKMKHNVTDAEIQTMLKVHTAANQGFPKPTNNMLYFVFLPSGVVVSDGSDQSCQVFCGYHNAINEGFFYAVMPFPDCAGCLRGMALVDALTQVSSHELCEAITDPVPGHGWYDNHFGEIGDICNGKTKRVGQWMVQLEWSNKTHNCI